MWHCFGEMRRVHLDVEAIAVGAGEVLPGLAGQAGRCGVWCAVYGVRCDWAGAGRRGWCGD